MRVPDNVLLNETSLICFLVKTRCSSSRTTDSFSSKRFLHSDIDGLVARNQSYLRKVCICLPFKSSILQLDLEILTCFFEINNRMLLDIKPTKFQNGINVVRGKLRKHMCKEAIT